ncbi:MAG: FMN-binding protein, partial [Gemmatimonadaceae bacterium]
PTPSQFKDGSYSGWGTSLHGDIQVSVEIRGGRIAATSIAQCLTRYSCSWIADLPAQVVAGQTVRVDLVSGATQSSEAFRAAVADALRQAR